MPVTIVKDKFLIEDIKKYTIVLVPMSANNSMNSGFAYEIGLNFPPIREKVQTTPYGDRRKFGTVSVFKDDGITFCICFMHTGGQSKQVEYVKYDSLADCLDLININFKGKTVASPILGSTKYDGRGNKEKIINIFKEHCTDIDLILYDYEERNFMDEIYYRTTTITQKFRRKEITHEEMMAEIDTIMWEKFNGILKPKPDDYHYKRPRIDRVNKEIIRINKNNRNTKENK